MSYRVRTDNFEGPFDLLLYLVSRQRVDIEAISISTIVDQYLEEVSRMTELDLDVASDFLLVASTLLEIKAQSLIPADRDETDEEIAELTPNEARDLLIEKLLAYKQYKNAAKMLEGRFETQARMHPRTFGPGPEFSDLTPDFLSDVTLDALGYLAATAYARREAVLLESEHIAAKPIPVEIHVKAIFSRIANKKRMRFSELIAADTPTPVVVVSFLAILELYKRSVVRLVQNDEFGDIDIEYIEGSSDPTFEGDDKITAVEEG